MNVIGVGRISVFPCGPPPLGDYKYPHTDGLDLCVGDILGPFTCTLENFLFEVSSRKLSSSGLCSCPNVVFVRYTRDHSLSSPSLGSGWRRIDTFLRYHQIGETRTKEEILPIIIMDKDCYDS